jgi:hypothetical protein
MGVTVDALKESAKQAIIAKFGPEIGAGYGFLMFGGYGVPGLVDDAKLTAAVATANTEGVGEFPSEMAVSLVNDVAKACLTATLEHVAPEALEALGVTAETFATAAGLVVAGLLEPTPIGAEFPTNSENSGPQQSSPAPKPAPTQAPPVLPLAPNPPVPSPTRRTTGQPSTGDPPPVLEPPISTPPPIPNLPPTNPPAPPPPTPPPVIPPPPTAPPPDPPDPGPIDPDPGPVDPDPDPDPDPGPEGSSKRGPRAPERLN